MLGIEAHRIVIELFYDKASSYCSKAIRMRKSNIQQIGFKNIKLFNNNVVFWKFFSLIMICFLVMYNMHKK